MSSWRLILSNKSDPYVNMAIDEALLQNYTYGESLPTLRVYGWEPAGITLGSSQKVDSTLNLAECRKDKIDFVRRMTGGEAILHDNDISYSLICSARDLNIPGSIKKSFRIITSFVTNTFRLLKLKPNYAGDEENYAHSDPSEFCFATTEQFDILVQGKKLGGNAQKRIRDVIFQHGSIPIELDFERINRYFHEDLSGLDKKVISLNDALGRQIGFSETSKLLVESFKTTFSVTLNRAPLTEAEIDLSHTLLEEKYKTKQWNYFRRARIITKDKE